MLEITLLNPIDTDSGPVATVTVASPTLGDVARLAALDTRHNSDARERMLVAAATGLERAVVDRMACEDVARIVAAI